MRNLVGEQQAFTMLIEQEFARRSMYGAICSLPFSFLSFHLIHRFRLFENHAMMIDVVKILLGLVMNFQLNLFVRHLEVITARKVQEYGVRNSDTYWKQTSFIEPEGPDQIVCDEIRSSSIKKAQTARTMSKLFSNLFCAAWIMLVAALLVTCEHYQVHRRISDFAVSMLQVAFLTAWQQFINPALTNAERHRSSHSWNASYIQRGAFISVVLALWPVVMLLLVPEFLYSSIGLTAKDAVQNHRRFAWYKEEKWTKNNFTSFLETYAEAHRYHGSPMLPGCVPLPHLCTGSNWTHLSSPISTPVGEYYSCFTDCYERAVDYLETAFLMMVLSTIANLVLEIMTKKWKMVEELIRVNQDCYDNEIEVLAKFKSHDKSSSNRVVRIVELFLPKFAIIACFGILNVRAQVWCYLATLIIYRLQLYKLVNLCSCPLPRGSEGMQAAIQVLRMIMQLALVTNAIVVCKVLLPLRDVLVGAKWGLTFTLATLFQVVVWNRSGGSLQEHELHLVDEFNHNLMKKIHSATRRSSIVGSSQIHDAIKDLSRENDKVE